MVPASYRLMLVGEHLSGSRKAAFCSLHSLMCLPCEIFNYHMPGWCRWVPAPMHYSDQPNKLQQEGDWIGAWLPAPAVPLFQQHIIIILHLGWLAAVRTLSWQTWHSFVSGQGWSSVQSHLYPRRGFFCIDQRLTNFLLSWWNNFHAHFQTCDPWWRLWCFGKVLILPESKD